MKRMVLLAFLLTGISVFAWAEQISQAEWFVGSDPGVGNGNAITIGSPAAQIGLNFTVGTAGLAPGFYRVLVRVRTDTTLRWGVPSAAFLVIAPGTATARLCTQFEWAIDNGTFTTVDVADSATITLNQIVATNSIALGLHRFRVRTTDDIGRTSQLADGFFIVSSINPPLVHQVTLMDYWVDSDPPITVDVSDGATTDFLQILSTSNISIGLHRFNLRARDETGRIGPTTSSLLIVTSPFGVAQPRTITAAEYYINSDPGPGNGAAIPLPDDGTYNQSQENVTGIATGLPIGLHLVGIRVRDNLGRWSVAITDTILVGPVLVIRSTGSNIILDWQSGSGVSQFNIFRADSADGPYTLIDSTAAQSYTDLDILNAQSRQYYRVTFKANELSSFRLPRNSRDQTSPKTE
jgi:hypothetical protein